MFIDIAYASEAAAEGATETVADGGVLGSLGISGGLLISQFINFAIVVAVLWFLVLKPLTKKMAERQKMIDDSIANAKKIEDTLARGEQKYQERIDQAKVEANKILEKASAETGKLTEEMKVKAKKEIEGLVDQARRNIKIEKDDMVKNFRSESAEIVTVALEKILSEKMTSEKDKKFIEELLKGIK